MTPENVTLGIAFIAGFISFVSPCVLPLVPAYIGYMGGRVTNTVATQMIGGGTQAIVQPSISKRFTTVLHGLAFVGGFTLVFVSIGLMTTAFLQQIGGVNVALVRDIIGRLGGVLIIFFGLHFMGAMPALFNRLLGENKSVLSHVLFSPVIALLGTALILWGFTGILLPPLMVTTATTAGDISRLNWPTLIALIGLAIFLLTLVLGGAFTRSEFFWTHAITAIQTALYTDTRRQMGAKGVSGLSGSAMMGMIFSAGWTPCIGPVYGAVLTLAANTGDAGRAGTLLIAYSLGLGVPFLLTALLLDGAQGILRRLQRYMRPIELLSGAFLILIGFLVATNSLQNLSQSLSVGEFADAATNLEDSVVNSLMGSPTDPIAQATAAPLGLNSITGAANSIQGPIAGTSVGDLVPDFQTVTDTGETIKMSDLRGQVVLLNFWATWCGPCRIEMPEFQKAYDAKQADGFTILAINNKETVADVVGFRGQLGLSFPMLMDEDAAIQKKFGVFSYPSTFVINREGIIIARQFGPTTAKQIQQVIDQALAA